MLLPDSAVPGSEELPPVNVLPVCSVAVKVVSLLSVPYCLLVRRSQIDLNSMSSSSVYYIDITSKKGPRRVIL